MSYLPGIALDLSGGQLSDLFFNFGLDNRRQLWSTTPIDEITEELERGAVLKDAQEFCSILGLDNETALHAQLVEDFISRC